MALMDFTVNNEVSMCSKLCLDSYNALQAKYDELQFEFGDQEAALTAYKLAMTGGMSSTVKIGLGYGIQSNAEVLGYEEEMSRVSDASSIVFSICPSNDSDGKLGAVSNQSVTDDPIPIPSVEQSEEYGINEWKGIRVQEGYSFERKPCYVCGSLSHLIKDCDYYEKKMAREAALKSKRVVHADVRQATPAWTNTNRVNKANQFTPRPVQLSNIRPNLSTASKTIKTGRVNVNTGRVNRPVSNNTSPKPSQVNLKSPKKCFSKQRSPVNRPFSRNTAHKSNKYAVKGKMGTAAKTSAGYVWRKVIPLSNTNSGPTTDSYVHVSQGPQGRPKPVKAWVPKRN
ncbi:ribonuclease H-like domain-containing protein [Tanacetum coccineum]